MRVDPELLAEWRAGCESASITMSARFEQLMRRDIAPMTAEQMAVDLLPSELAREFKSAVAYNGETITAALAMLADIYIQYRGRDYWKDGDK